MDSHTAIKILRDSIDPDPHIESTLTKALKVLGDEIMAEENPGFDMMRQATAKDPEGKRESEPVTLLRLTNRELGEETTGRIHKLTKMLEPYLALEPQHPTNEVADDSPPKVEPVLILRLIKENRSCITTVNGLLDILIARLQY